MDREMLKNLTKNQVSDLTDALVQNMKYADSSIDYPSFDKAKIDDGVMAEWFYPVFSDSNDFSELTAIHMYVTQEATHEEAGELFLGIALTEMKHYDKLQDFIKKIGGKIDRKFDNKSVEVGDDVDDALKIAISSEEKTIDFYEKLQTRLVNAKQSDTVTIAIQFLSKLIADEQVHLNLLKERLEEREE